MLRHPSACVVVLLVLASACSSGDEADTTPTGSPVAVADTTSTSSPVAVEAKEGESPLEGDWYDSNGNKTLVVRGDIAEFFYGQGPISVNTGVDPNQVTLPSEDGPLTTIFKLEAGRLQLVLKDPAAPLPESVEDAAASDPELYFVVELFRGDVLFPSGVWTPSGNGLPAMYNVQGAASSTGSLIVGSISVDHGLFVSTDSGASWRRAGGGFPEAEPVWALTTVGGRIFAGTQGQGVFISDDGGETWTASNLGLAATGPDCPGDPGADQSQILDIAGFGSTVFVVGFCGVSRSDDLGETWREINEGLPDHFGSTSLAVGDGVAYVSSPEWHVFRLDWEHDRWEPVSGEVELPTTQVEIEGSLFAASTAGLRRSDDGGETWEDVSISPGRPVPDLVVADGVIFALTSGVYWSTDLGDTWHPYNTADLPGVFDLEVQGDQLLAIGRRGVFSAPLPDRLPAPQNCYASWGGA